MSNPTRSVGAGSAIRLHFRIRLESGFVAEDTFGSEPELVTLGSGELLPAVEQRIIGMKVGDRVSFTLSPLEAYGFRANDRLYRLERDLFTDAEMLETNRIVGFTLPNGEEVAGTIVTADDTGVVVDLNHPLAGYDVIFDIEIVEIK